MSGDFLSSVPGKPFEAPDEPATEAYAATPPSTVAKIGATVGEGPTSPTARFSLTRWLSNAPYMDTAGGRFGRGLLQAFGNTTLAEDPDAPQVDLTQLRPAPQLSPEEANERYAPLGPDGKKQSITDTPLPEPVARSLGESRTAQIEREGIFRRYENSHGWLVNRATDMGAMLDPLNAASMMVPGLGEERILAALGSSTLAARTIARIGAGATAGAAGMVPVAALDYGVAKSEGTDFGIRDFLSDVAMGAALGGVIHGGVVGGYRELRYARSGRAIGPGFPKPPSAEPGAPPPAPQPLGGGEGLPPVDNVSRETVSVPEPEVIKPAPQTSFDEETTLEKNRLERSYGAARPRAARLREEAWFAAFNREAGPDLDARLGAAGLGRADAEDLYKMYDRKAGEHPRQALDRAIDTWVDQEERKALQDNAYDSEWQREMAELQRHFDSNEGIAAGATTTTDFRGETKQWPERAPLGGSFEERAAPDIPFEPAVAEADPVTKHAAIGAATSQLLDGRQVDVLPLFGAHDPHSTAGSQRQVERNGYATGMPQAEFDAVNEAVYPPARPEDENTPPQGGTTNGDRGGGRAGGRAPAGSRAGSLSARQGHAPGSNTGRRPGAAGEAGARPGGSAGGAAGAEAGGAERLAAEAGAEGKPQTLLPGVEPITDRERAALQIEKPLTGGNAPPPEGGLFDEGARAQADMFQQKLAESDPDLALAIRDLEGQELHPEDKAEIEAATQQVAAAERQEDAFVQAATCIAEGEG